MRQHLVEKRLAATELALEIGLVEKRVVLDMKGDLSMPTQLGAAPQPLF
jgi:hypothetical protein